MRVFVAGATGAVSPATSKFLVLPAAGAVIAGLFGLVRRGKKKVIED